MSAGHEPKFPGPLFLDGAKSFGRTNLAVRFFRVRMPFEAPISSKSGYLAAHCSPYEFRQRQADRRSSAFPRELVGRLHCDGELWVVGYSTHSSACSRVMFRTCSSAQPFRVACTRSVRRLNAIRPSGSTGRFGRSIPLAAATRRRSVGGRLLFRSARASCCSYAESRPRVCECRLDGGAQESDVGLLAQRDVLRTRQLRELVDIDRRRDA